MKRIFSLIASSLTFNLMAVDHNSLLWQYNKSMKLEKMIEFADAEHPRSSEYFYSLTGKLEKIIKPDGTVIEYTYDFKDRLKRVQSSDNSIQSTYFYDLDDKVKRIEDGASLIPFTFEVRNDYDDSGRKTATIYPDGSSARYEYKGSYLTKITRISAEGKELYSHEYQWNNQGKLKKSLLPKDRGSIVYTWDHKGRIQGIRSDYWSEDIDLWNGYTSDGNLQNLVIKDSCGSTQKKYSYDSEGRIRTETSKEKGALNYSYDPLNNIIAINQNSFIVDSYNQTLETLKAKYSYDANGNLSAKETPTSRTYFSYDALDRLTRVTIDGHESITYSYDSNNRRLMKRSADRTLYYIYDGSNEVGCMDENGKIIELRVLGVGLGAEIGASIAVEVNDHCYIPIHDHRGNSTCLIDMDSGKIVESCSYSAFGMMEITGDSINPWKFYSKRYDSETGLVFFGKRYFSSDLGKWITPDPLGFGDNANRYVFLNNNPINCIDLYGLFSISAFWQSVKTSLQDWYTTFKNEINPLASAAAFDQSVKKFYQFMMGDFPDFLTGEGAEVTTYGKLNGEVNGSVKISFINGVLCNQDEVLKIVNSISKANGDQEVYYVCRGAQGWTRDIIKAFLVKMGLLSHEACQMAAVWKQLIAELGGTESGGTIIHYAHSVGATETIRARKLMSAEELQMIQVITLGPATFVPNESFQSVVNYVSVRDGVCYLDPISYINALVNKPNHVIFLGAHSDGYPLIDHLFGESEKGAYQTAYYCKSLAQLVDDLGHPSPDSRGIFYAIQAILYDNHLIYFPVHEEGFSHEDYMYGLNLLESKPLGISLNAILAPGVGSSSIIQAITKACHAYGSILIMTENDLYDYLTESGRNISV